MAGAFQIALFKSSQGPLVGLSIRHQGSAAILRTGCHAGRLDRGWWRRSFLRRHGLRLREGCDFRNSRGLLGSLRSVGPKRRKMLFHLLQEGMLIFKILVEGLNLGLNVRQFARRLIKAAFLLFPARDKFSPRIDRKSTR